MEKDKTGVQLNLGHTSTDDYITEKYVLPLLRDEKMRNKLIEDTEQLQLVEPRNLTKVSQWLSIVKNFKLF